MLAKLRRRIWGMDPKHVNPAGLKRGTVKYIFRVDKQNTICENIGFGVVVENESRQVCL